MSTDVPAHIVLVGLMATGKSTVAARLAERLGRRLVDTDAEVERTAGRAVREIWAEDGEPEFRRLESTALARVLAEPEASVIAAAGGVVLAEENRTALAEADARVVWLRARPDTLAERVRRADDQHRPLLDGDTAGMLETMFADRSHLYAAVADVVVDVDDLDVDAVTAAVVEAVDDEESR